MKMMSSHRLMDGYFVLIRCEELGEGYQFQVKHESLRNCQYPHDMAITAFCPCFQRRAIQKYKSRQCTLVRQSIKCVKPTDM